MKSKKISVKFDQNLCDFGGLVFSLVVVAVELAVSPIPGRSPRQTRWPSESQTVEVTALWFAQTKWQFTRFTASPWVLELSPSLPGMLRQGTGCGFSLFSLVFDAIREPDATQEE